MKHILIAYIAAALMPTQASAQTWPEGSVMQLTAAMNNSTAGVAQGTYSVQIADLSAFTNF